MDGLLEELAAEKAEALVRAIERAADGWKRGVLQGDFEAEVLRVLLPLAKHERPKVRQAVADAALYMPDEAFDEIIGDLLKDPNGFVQHAAQCTHDERSRDRRKHKMCEERASSIEEQREKIAASHDGKAGLRAAELLCDLTEAHRSEKLHHELDKVTDLLMPAVVALRTSVRRGDADRTQLTAEVEAVDAHLKTMFDVLKSQRSHARMPPPRFRAENVRAIVEEQVERLRGRIGDARRGRLRVEIDVDAEIVIDVDRGLLGQAFTNILQNAVEAYPDDGAIFVGVRAEPLNAGTRVAITFEDRGRGMPAEAIAQLGQPFVSSKGIGRGLGVANVRKMIVRVHGGTVETASEVGVGTRVRVVLPRKQG